MFPSEPRSATARSVLLAPPAMPSTTCSPSRASPPISQPSVSRSSRAALLLASVSPQEPSHWPQREKRSPSALPPVRSEEHTSELQSLMRISYAVFCLNKKKQKHTTTHT